MTPLTPVPSVVLDANVLFPASLRDILLRCAEKNLFRLRVSQQIWDEVVRNLFSSGRLTSEQVARLDTAIQAFLRRTNALVTGYKSLIPNLTNDPKDRHVLAVAIHAHAQTIVTVNLKDFPAHALSSHGVVAQHPDPFLTCLYHARPDVLVQIVNDQAEELKNPPLSVTDVLDTLAQHAPTVVRLLREAIAAREDVVDQQ